MSWLKWLPWRFVIRRVARAHGFLDPMALLARLHRFAQPSEVGEPVELLRAGVVFHARGLINSRLIQHNLAVGAGGGVDLSRQDDWHGRAPDIAVRVPGYRVARAGGGDVALVREHSR